MTERTHQTLRPEVFESQLNHEKILRRAFFVVLCVGILIFGGSIWAALYYGQPNLAVWINSPDDRQQSALKRALGPWPDFPGMLKTELALLRDVKPERFAIFADNLKPYQPVHRRGLFGFASSQSRSQMQTANENLEQLLETRLSHQGNYRSTSDWRELSRNTERLLTEIKATDDRWQMFYNLGILSYWQGKFAESLDHFERALERLETDKFSESEPETQRRATEARIVSHYAIGMSEIRLALGRGEQPDRTTAERGMASLLRAIDQVKVFVDIGRFRDSGRGYERVTLPATGVRTRDIWNDLAVAHLLSGGSVACGGVPGGSASISTGQDCPDAAQRKRQVNSRLGSTKLSSMLFDEGPFSPGPDIATSLVYAKSALAPFVIEDPGLTVEPLMNHNLAVMLAVTGRYEDAAERAARQSVILPTIERRKADVFLSFAEVATYRVCPAGNSGWRKHGQERIPTATRDLYQRFASDGMVQRPAFPQMSADFFSPSQVEALDHWLFFCHWRDLLMKDEIFGFIWAYKALNQTIPLGGALVAWKDEILGSYLRRAFDLAEEHRTAGRDQEAKLITDFTAALIFQTSVRVWLSMTAQTFSPPLLWLVGAALSFIALVVFLILLMRWYWKKKKLYRSVFMSAHHADRMMRKRRA